MGEHHNLGDADADPAVCGDRCAGQWCVELLLGVCDVLCVVCVCE